MVRPTAFSPVLLCLLAIGLAGGAAASFVVSSSQPFAQGGSFQGELISPTLLGVLLLVPLVAGFGSIIYQRLHGGPMPLPPSLIIIAGLLVAALLLLALLSYLPHVAPTLGGTPSGGGGGGGGTNNSSHSHSGNNSSGTGPFVPFVSSLPVPPWLVFVVVVVIALAAIGIAVPAARSWTDRRAGRRAAAATGPERAAATAAFGRALSDLAGGADPRGVVERLYAQLLGRLPSISGDVAPLTPEEIRRESLLPLGIRPDAATEITRIFEEARYSSHPIDGSQAARVRAAFGLAWRDLTGAAPAA